MATKKMPADAVSRRTVLHHVRELVLEARKTDRWLTRLVSEPHTDRRLDLAWFEMTAVTARAEHLAKLLEARPATKRKAPPN